MHTIAIQNNQPYLFTILEKDSLTTTLTFSEIDQETLSPINYKYVTLPTPKAKVSALNGVNIAGNIAEICIQVMVNPQVSKLVFYKIDLQTQTVLDSEETIANFCTETVRARSINQKLIV